jgi:hypothetical protein
VAAACLGELLAELEEHVESTFGFAKLDIEFMMTLVSTVILIADGISVHRAIIATPEVDEVRTKWLSEMLVREISRELSAALQSS